MILDYLFQCLSCYSLFFFFLMIRRPPRSTLFLHDALPIAVEARDGCRAVAARVARVLLAVAGRVVLGGAAARARRAQVVGDAGVAAGRRRAAAGRLAHA